MADKITQALMGAPYSDEDIMRMATRPDPIREYLADQWQSSIGDAGANAGKAAATGALGIGSGHPLLGVLMALGYGGRAAKDWMRAQDFKGAAGAFGRTGLPGAPTGPQLPLPDDPMMGAGRFADPRLLGR